MNFILLYIIGQLCMIMSGMFIGKILITWMMSIDSPEWTDYAYAILGFIMGNYALIACIGKASAVK